MVPKPPCSAPSAHSLKLHILVSFFKGNRLWLAKHLLCPGSSRVDSGAPFGQSPAVTT